MTIKDHWFLDQITILKVVLQVIIMMLSSKAAMHVVILIAVFLGAVTAAPQNGMLGLCAV